jgi:hypothetical protein
MKTQNHLWPRWLNVLAGLGLAIAPALLAQLGRFAGKNFKFPEYYEASALSGSKTNRLKSLLTGTEARYLSNNLYDITRMRLDTYQVDGHTSLVAKAPQCLLDVNARTATSTGRLEITSWDGALFVEGNEGFLVRMTNSSLTISNHVRTVIRQALSKSTKP